MWTSVAPAPALSRISLPRMLYQGALAAARILVAPARLVRGEAGAGFTAEYEERLGRSGPDGPFDIWLQAASVGEVRAAGGLIGELLRRRPGLTVALTATTRTGRTQADVLARKLPIGTAYFPLDFRSASRTALARLRPRLFVLFETEIWPNIWAEAARSGARIVVVNGRLSHGSFARYRLVRPLVRETLALADCISAQSEADAGRFVELGAPRGRVLVAGNLKYDLGDPPEAAALADFARAIGLSPGTPLLVAGSTAEGEDRLVVEAFRTVLASAPEARLLIAPRHPERFAPAADEAARAGLCVRRRSQPGGGDAAGAVVILDTIGELRLAYGVAAAAFVGGSLVPAGGQNLLEPASAGIAPICGPHTENFSEAAARLEDARALERVADPEELAAAFMRALRDPQAARAAGERARAALAAGAGATARTAGLLFDVLDGTGASTGDAR